MDKMWTSETNPKPDTKAGQAGRGAPEVLCEEGDDVLAKKGPCQREDAVCLCGAHRNEVRRPRAYKVLQVLPGVELRQKR